jgi:integrase
MAINLAPQTNSEWLFPREAGNHMTQRYYRRYIWTPAAKAYGLTPTACRHTFAYWAIRRVISTYTLARIMGTSEQMIDKTYGHLTPDGIEEAMHLIRGIRGEDGREIDSPRNATARAALS